MKIVDNLPARPVFAHQSKEEIEQEMQEVRDLPPGKFALVEEQGGGASAAKWRKREGFGVRQVRVGKTTNPTTGKEKILYDVYVWWKANQPDYVVPTVQTQPGTSALNPEPAEPGDGDLFASDETEQPSLPFDDTVPDVEEGPDPVEVPQVPPAAPEEHVRSFQEILEENARLKAAVGQSGPPAPPAPPVRD